MMLTLDVEFLLSVCFAARNPSDPTPDWPPQPDRLFSALVATWAARGEQEREKSALEWLEGQSPPLVRASAAEDRFAPTVFVPPNDVGGKIHALPDRRKRQERRFPAAIPLNPVVSYSWPAAAPDPNIFEALQVLARDTPYVGHSTSVVRCFFRVEDESFNAENVTQSKRRVYSGRLAELQTAFARGRRPSPGETVEQSDPVRRELPVQSVFGSDWIVFADAGGFCPDLRQAAVVARAFRAAMMSSFEGGPVPEIISGHTSDGSPTKNPHMAVFPLANVGWQWSDGRLMGMALCLPRSASSADHESVFDALARIVQPVGSGDIELSIHLPGGKAWRLVRQAEPTGSSLKPYRYLSRAKVWATATPIALDSHPKAKNSEEVQQEIADIIAESCTRTGLPRPSIVVPDKHSALRGTPPARPSRGSPAWTRWALPASLRGRVLTHAVLAFDTDVQGPIALGAGRFAGLGLCLPIQHRAIA